MRFPLTVLIPTHGRPTLLKQTLNSIAECELPDAYKELVVVENGSRAGVEVLVQALPGKLNARYMHLVRGNKSHALNEALETVANGLVVFFDDDVQVHRDTLTAYKEAAEEQGTGHFFGGPVEVKRETDPPEWAEGFFPYSVRGYDLVESRWQDNYLGFNWAAFKADLLDVGGFNAQLGPGAESGTSMGDESELQNRMMEVGCDGVDVMEAVVTHYISGENLTIGWLLHRKYEEGIAEAVRNLRGNGCKALFEEIKALIVSLGVFLKEMSLQRKTRAMPALLHVVYRAGIIRYMINHM